MTPRDYKCGEIDAVAFSPDSKLLAWAAGRELPGRPIEGDPGFVMSVAFSPDRKTLAAGTWTGGATGIVNADETGVITVPKVGIKPGVDTELTLVRP